MKFTRKVFSGCSSLMFSVLILASATTVRADQNGDDAPNYLLTTRIVNRCNPTENPQGPQVPAPLVANAGCPSVHPNANWSVDISWFDPVFEKAYIADRDNKALDIVDTRSDTVVGQATGFVGVVAGTNTSGPNGVVTTHNPNQLWGGDGNGDVRIYSLDAKGLNPTLLKVVLATDPKLNVTRRADEVAYDPDHQLVLMAWDDAADLLMAFITVNSNPTVVGTISLKTNCPALSGCSTGGIEQPAYDRRIGRFLVSVPSSTLHPNGEVLVINPATMLVEKAWDTTDPLTGAACNPNGLAIGPGHQALLGCSGGAVAGNPLVTLIIDDRGSGPNGSNVKVIKTITQVGASDEVWFNPGDNNYYTASSNFTSTGKVGGTNFPVLGIIEAGNDREGPEWIQNVVTGAGSHSVTAVYGFGCDRDDRDRDRGEGLHRNGCDHDHDDIVDNRVYVPLRTNQAGNSEVGGIGIVRRP